MKKLLLLLTLFTTQLFAQNDKIRKIADDVSKEDLKKNLFHLASDEMEGRLMATRGDTLASLFIAHHFKKSKLEAPYENGKSYFQAVVYDRKEFPVTVLSIGNKTYQNFNGWYFSRAAMNAVNLSNLPVVFAGYAIEDAKYNDFSNIDVKGKAVIIINGQPRDNDGNYYLSGNNRPASITPAMTTLKQKGAALVLVVNPRFSNDAVIQQKTAYRPVLKNNYSTPSPAGLPSISLSEERADELLLPSNNTISTLKKQIDETFKPVSMLLSTGIGLHIEMNLVPTTAPNVIGMIKGTDPAAGHIIVSAHHDHDGKSADGIYYGAVDNASGTVAIMEIARLMNKAADKGERPKRTIIFASYTGEERGLLGAYYLANNPVLPVDKTWGVLNIDMMGRVDTFYSGRRADSMYAYILVKDTLNRGLRTALYNAHDASGKELKLDTHYEQPQFMQRRLLGSDQYPFFLKGVPFIRIDCGFSKDYHKLTDTPDKINYELLQKQVKLAFLTAWNMANN